MQSHSSTHLRPSSCAFLPAREPAVARCGELVTRGWRSDRRSCRPASAQSGNRPCGRCAQGAPTCCSLSLGGFRQVHHHGFCSQLRPSTRLRLATYLRFGAGSKGSGLGRDVSCFADANQPSKAAAAGKLVAAAAAGVESATMGAQRASRPWIEVRDVMARTGTDSPAAYVESHIEPMTPFCRRFRSAQLWTMVLWTGLVTSPKCWMLSAPIRRNAYGSHVPHRLSFTVVYLSR